MGNKKKKKKKRKKVLFNTGKESSWLTDQRWLVSHG